MSRLSSPVVVTAVLNGPLAPEAAGCRSGGCPDTCRRLWGLVHRRATGPWLAELRLPCAVSRGGGDGVAAAEP